MSRSVMDKDTIISKIEEHIGSTSYTDWYVGITKDPYSRRRKHEEDDYVTRWKDWNAGTDTVAREVETHFLNLHMRGAGGGGDNDSKYVYVYS